MTNICICGGGNLGHVCAGFLSAQSDVEVSLLTTHPDSWSPTIDIDDPDGKTYHGHLSSISSNPAEALLSVDIVLLCLPGYAIRPTLQKIAPYISDRVWVGSVVSSTGFFFEAMKILPMNPLFGFQRVPFISRIVEYGHRATLKGYKKSLSVAIEQASDKQLIRQQLQNLFKVPVTLMDSYFEVSLSNSNPLLHPARLYTMWKDWHPGVVYERNPFFYSDWTLEASELLIKMDDEFQALLRALNIREGAIPTILDYYECSNAESLTQKFHDIPAFKGILSPMIQLSEGYLPDFNSRYFTEDFPYGMRYIVDLAEKNKIDIPVIKHVYDWGIVKSYIKQ